MTLFGRDAPRVVTSDEALPGRDTPIPAPELHAVHPDRRIQPPFPDGTRTMVLGMGCFWGAEQLFWQTPGVHATAVGYAGGHTPNPTYEEVCTGRTGHTEAVLVVYDPTRVDEETLLKVFWEGHDPTQGMRQGNDRGSQYRSAIYYADEAQRERAEASRDAYQRALRAAGHGDITTEIGPLRRFYYAEDFHQQYLYKVPGGYCGLGETGVACPTGLTTNET